MRGKSAIFLAMVCIILALMHFLFLFIPPQISTSPIMVPVQMIQFHSTFTAGIILKRLCSFSASIKLLTSARAVAPPSRVMIVDLLLAQSHRSDVLMNYIQAQYETAWSLIQKYELLGTHPDRQDLLLAGITLFHLERYAPAVEYAERLVREDPSDSRAIILQFRTRLGLYGLDEYEQRKGEWLLLLRSHPELLLSVGDLLWNFGYHHQAGQLYEFGVDLVGSKPALLYRQAVYSHRILGQNERAFELLTTLLETDCFYPGAREEFGLLLAHRPSEPIAAGYFSEKLKLLGAVANLGDFTGIMMIERNSLSAGNRP